MPSGLNITTDWERLDQGTPEERACFGAIGIQWNDIWLTEGLDTFANVIRKAPYVSGYHLAEWVAWNWWRLRWEPQSNNPDWGFAHRLSAIGHGYAWPDITIFSDGQRTALIPKPTSARSGYAYRYIANIPAFVPSTDFETAIDQFIKRTRDKLRSDGIANTNLDAVWSDVTDERNDPAMAQRRKFEALLGQEPDQADEEALNALLSDIDSLGEAATTELAAGHDSDGNILTYDSLNAIAARNGFDYSPQDAIRLSPDPGLLSSGDVPAWQLGGKAAGAVRNQANLGCAPIPDKVLAELAGIAAPVLDATADAPSFAYALDRSDGGSRIVFRSKWKVGRRFELARILGDRLISAPGDHLFPSTRAHTYRQKMQRSFAAELLSPFDAVEAALNDDYSDDAQQEVADIFGVSPFTISTLLVNHGRISRNELEMNSDTAVAQRY